jgi:hypothetical protein
VSNRDITIKLSVPQDDRDPNIGQSEAPRAAQQHHLARHLTGYEGLRVVLGSNLGDLGPRQDPQIALRQFASQVTEKSLPM